MTERVASTLILVGTIIIVALCIILGTIFGARAHEWYGYDCCGEDHCHRVADGVVIDTTDGGVDVRGFNEHLKRNSPKLRESLDTDDHVCSTDNPWGSNTLYCVYHVKRGY